MPNRFKVSDKPIFHCENPFLTGNFEEPTEEYCIIDTLLGETYPQSDLQKICNLLNDMEKDYQAQRLIIDSSAKLREIAIMLKKVEL